MDELLEEKEIKNHVTPAVFKYKCDDKMEDIPYPLPDSIFRMGLIGRSGSGKSNLVQALTQAGGKKRIYNKRFSNVFIVSPSGASMDSPPKLPKDRFYNSVKDLPTIFDRLQNEEDMEGRTLIILDDLGSEIKSGSSEEAIILKKLFNNGRHIGRALLDELTGEQQESGAISIMITAQKMSQLPRWIRHQLTHLAVFDMRNTKSELLTLYDEFFAVDKPVFNEIIDRVFSIPYNFLFVDCKKSLLFNGFRSQFNVKSKNYL